MSRFSKGFALAVSILVAVALVAACSSSSPSPGPVNPPYGSPSSGTSSGMPMSGLVQSNGQGSVTVAAKWEGEKNGQLLFSVSMDTHSVDLDRYDLGQLALLRDDGGMEYRPSSWLAAPGGHHREGTLAFPLPDSLKQGGARYLQLIIRGVAGIEERVLRWEMGS